MAATNSFSYIAAMRRIATKPSKLFLVAVIFTALAFTFSGCSSGGGGGKDDDDSSSSIAVSSSSSIDGGGSSSSVGGSSSSVGSSSSSSVGDGVSSSSSDGSDSNGIEGITFENYPRVDGSTSTDPLNKIILAKLLGWTYEWRNPDSWYVLVNTPDGIQLSDVLGKVKSSQTHNSIINLIENNADIIISARTMSEDEKSHANSLGVLLIETPIALDALDFLINEQNTVNSLTVKQVQDIYLGNITNWSEVGGADEAIKPFIRNANSGSQEMMKEIVMNHTNIPDWDLAYYGDDVIPSMLNVYYELNANPNGICFTPHYYKEFIIREADGTENTKSIAINGIESNENTIRGNTYPFVADVYVSIRSDLDHNSMAYKMYEWLQTQAGKEVIAESGYVPK
jgi:phosphate transport system substrate-binding protein